MELLLLAAFALFLIAMLIALLILLYFGITRSNKRRRQFSILVVSSSGEPLEGVDVKLGDEVGVTGSYGKASFHPQPGEKELHIIAESHAEFRQKIKVGDEPLYHARLQKDRPTQESKSLEEAVSSARGSREEIGTGYNPAIPDFMFNLCLAIHKMALDEVRSESGAKARSESQKSAAFAITSIAKGMVERRNLSLYAKAKGKKPRTVELPSLRTPDLISARQKLAQVDLLITHSTGKSAIYPPLVLWKTAQKLLLTPSVFNLRLAAFILDSAEKMIAELGDFLA
ncbi:MAG: hypothetical protein ABIF01_00300 [Candidatus Micrarchaeota archaeon]